MKRSKRMSEEPHNYQPHEQKSWLERLSQVLLREPQDREQLVELLRDAEDRNLLDAEALKMIEGVLQVSELRARDIMVPRGQMVVIPENAKLNDILPVVIESAHSRFPIISENKDEVVGMLLAKDLLPFAFEGEAKPFDLKSIMRKTVFVPESKRLDALLREFRLTRNHMALVVDEYGSIAGLVTIEDVLEQIVGEIEDEHDEDEFYIKKHSANEFIVKALTPIEDFNDYFSDNIDDEDFDTIGGLVMRQFGHLPRVGEETSYGRYDFRVLNADKRRIHLLKVRAS